MTVKEKKKFSFRNFAKTNGAILLFVLLLVLASLFVPQFAGMDNLSLIIKQAAVPIIGGIGMMVVLMTGGIDLSFGYMVGLSSAVIGLLIKSAGMNMYLAIVITLLIGFVVGAFNGFCVQKIHVPAFITTLGTGFIILGIAKIISHGAAINDLPEEFLSLGKTDVFEYFNTTVVISLVFCIVSFYVIHFSTYGRKLSSFGLSEPASRLSGVKTSKINMSAYMICSVIAAICGILLTIDVNCAQPTMGGGDYTFTIITGCVLGGVSLFGGVGTVPGVICGALTLKIINSCILLTNVPYYYFGAIQGLVILLDIIIENVKNRKL